MIGFGGTSIAGRYCRKPGRLPMGACLKAIASKDFDADRLLLLVLSFLNDKNIKYRVTRFSPSHDKREIEHELSRLGIGLLEGVPIEVLGRGLILAVLPTALGLHLDDLSNLFEPKQVRFLTPGEFSQRCPFK